MLNRENSVNKRIYADFSIETLLKTDYFRDRGTLRHGSDPFEIDDCEGSGTDWDAHSDLVNCANQSNSGQTRSVTNVDDDTAPEVDNPKLNSFPWLSCTRFKPPKLTRSRRKSNSSKRNGRGPRIPFSSHQLIVLERTFKGSQYLSSKAIGNLAESLQLTEARVKIWFQNRRARYRRESDGSSSSPIRPGITLRQPSTPPSTFRFQDQGHHHTTSFIPAIPKSSSPHNSMSITPGLPSHSYTPVVTPSLSKQSFRHLINDLNLMTANANSPTNLTYSCFKNYCNDQFPPSIYNIFSKESYP